MKRPVNDDELRDIVNAGVWGVSTVAQAKAKWDKGNMLDTALALVEEAYRRVGCAHTRVFTGPEGDHNVHVRALPIAGSTIGVAWFNDGTCGDHVNHHIDSTWRPGLHQLCNLLCHEFGHNNNLPHTFSGQETHHGIMSYSPRYPFQGFRTGSEGSLPKDPSWAQLIRQYGGEPVPSGGGTPPPLPPSTTPHNFTIKAGDSIVMTLQGRHVTLEVKDVEGDDGPGTAKRVMEAFAGVPKYKDRTRHRQALLMLYSATGEAVNGGDVTLAAGQQALSELRGVLLTKDKEKWKWVFEVADDVNSGDGLLAVAEGLSEGEALSPEVLAVTKLIIKLLPEGNLKLILNLVIAVLDGLGSQEASDGSEFDLPRFKR